MADKYCGDEHSPGEPFPESGNIYCKKCGKFLTVVDTTYLRRADIDKMIHDREAAFAVRGDSSQRSGNDSIWNDD